MTDLSKDDAVAALRRAIEEIAHDAGTPEGYAQAGDDITILRALADSLREGQEAWQGTVNQSMMYDYPGDVMIEDGRFRPVWIIPEPKVKP